MGDSKKYLQLKEELKKVTGSLKSKFDGHDNFLYKLNGKLYFSKFIHINDETGEPYMPLTKKDLKGYQSVSGPKLNFEQYKAAKKIEISSFIKILDYIQNKIEMLLENEELTVKDQRTRLEFWENLRQAIGGKCPHNFNFDDYCEICGEPLREVV